MSVNFIPDINALQPFRFWCQKTLPLVYDDSLSYYELLCKVVDYTNKLIEDDTQLVSAYTQLQGYVNNYFDNLDVQSEINAKLDRMAADGTLTSLIQSYITPYIEQQEIYNTQTRTIMNNRLDEQDAEISTIHSLVGSPLTASSSGAMTDRSRVYVYTGSTGGGLTNGHWYYWNGTAWADGGVYNSQGISTDTTLTVSGAAADAKVTGDRITSVTDNVELSLFDKNYNNLVHTSIVASNNNNAITNNLDGTYTIGTNDYGTTFFGDGVVLKPGMYLLYGVTEGASFISPQPDYSTARIFNTSSEFKVITISEQSVYYLGYRTSARPSTSFTIRPALIQTNLAELIEMVSERSTYTNNYLISGNKNYLDERKLNIDGSFFNTNTGALTENNNFRCGYIQIPAAGTYKLYQPYNTFGGGYTKIPLFDCNRRWIKTITGASSDQRIVNFTISESDFKYACYIGVSAHKSDVVYPMLILNGDYPTNRTYFYPDYIFTTNSMYKKTLVCGGDSIAAGFKDLPDNLGAWFGRTARARQMYGKNYGENGASITNGLTFQSGEARHCICNDVSIMHNEYPNADYIILEGGTNDADVIGSIIEGSTPALFGSWVSNNFTRNTFDTSTFCGAVEAMFYDAVTLFNGKKIGFIIPPEMGAYSPVTNNRRAYFDTIIQIAAKWHIPVLDLWKVSTMDCRITTYWDPSLSDTENINQHKYYADGQHPTSKGYDLLQDKILTWMETL